jgi:16S rRNA (adenine1518-N6/adenine1519-N6)-dimethyltransferase
MRPKSSLGQNFLKNPGIVMKIISFSGVEEGDAVLEIGPGKGVLTTRLLASAARVVAVEKDDELFEFLKEKFVDEPNLSLVHGDVLDLNMDTLVSPGMKVVANLPYNIATRIVLLLAEVPHLLASVVVMVQKEVAQRMCASLGQSAYSALTVLLSSVFECFPGFVVGPKNFSPEPKVDSQVVKLVPRENPLPHAQRDSYRQVVLCAFGQRRKMLRNSLMNLPGITKDTLEGIALRSEISLEKRPQNLSWEDYARLSQAYRQIITS